MNSIRSLLAVVALAGLANPQVASSGGPVLAVPVHVTATPGSPLTAGGVAGRGVLSKKAGFERLDALGPVVPGVRPDFGLTAACSFEVDALSVGLDQIHADCSGFIDYSGCNCWSALLFAVEDGTGAASATGVVAREHGSVDGAGADLFSYVPRAASLPSAFRGRTERVLDSRELGLFRGGATPVKGQIQSLDAYISLYELDDDVFAFVDPDPTLYFSVTDATKHLVPPSWWFGSPPSGATILCVKVQTAVHGVFIALPPLYTHSDLGLPASADIDALAVDSRDHQVILSLTRASTPLGLSQLLYVEDCVDGTPSLVDLTESDGTPTGSRPVADGTGTGASGEVRGVCEWDPSVVQARPGMAGLMAHVASTPQAPLVPQWTSMQAAAYRSCDAAGNVTFSYFATGAAPGTGPSTAFLILGFPGTPVYETIFSAPRVDPSRPVGGTFILPVVSLVGFPVDLIWVDSRSGAIAISHPLRIHL